MTFMPTDPSDLASALAGYGRKTNPYDTRRRYGMQLLQQGSDTSPIQSPWQGVGRLAQALAGGLDLYMADRDEKAADKKRSDALAQAMAEPDPQKRIGLLAAYDPDVGSRMAGQLAIEQYKQNANRQTNADAGRIIASSYGMPGGQTATGMPAPLPGGTPAPGGFNNNAGNIRTTQAAWQGEGAPQNGFKTFATPQDGVNAMVRNYQAYVQQNPNMTVGQALQKWAPPNENDSYGYLRTITEGTGINPGMPLAELMKDPAAFAHFLEAQTRLEKGGVPQGFTPDTFSNATAPQGGPQPGGLQIDMPGPGAPRPMPVGGAAPPNANGQGADGMPPAPNPQTVAGQQPVVSASQQQPAQQPPDVPDVPKPAPDPNVVARVEALRNSGTITTAEAIREIEADINRRWERETQRRTLEYKQKLGDYEQANKQRSELDTKMATELAAKRIDNFEAKVRPAAISAVNDINAIHSVRQVLDSGAFTGTGAEAKTFLAKIGEQLGIPSEQAVNTQVLGAVLAKRVLAASGGTLGTGFSNADRDFVERASGGQISMDETAMRRLADIGERSARQTIKQYGEEAGRIQRMRGVSQAFDPEHFAIPVAPTYAEWSKANPLAAPQGAPAASNAPAQGGGVPQGAVELLRSNPGLANAFDAKYGPGAAARVLGR